MGKKSINKNNGKRYIQLKNVKDLHYIGRVRHEVLMDLVSLKNWKK